MPNKLHFALWPIGLAAAAITASPARAAPPTSAPAQVGEVIVTAQKRQQRLSDVPMSVTAVSGADLERIGLHSAAALEKVVPGFIFTESAYGAPIYTLRGIGFFSEALGAPPAVSVYQDQVPLPYSAMTDGAGLDAARVEVLKGPQGALYGQNSTGGAIDYIPAAPTRTPGAGLALTYGRFNEADVEGYVSGPITRDLTGRLSFRSENRDGWQTLYAPPAGASGGGRNGSRDFKAARVILDWRPSGRFSARFNLNGWLDRSQTLAKQKIGYSPLTPLAEGGYPGSPGYPDLQADLAAYPNAPHNDQAAGFDQNADLRRKRSFFQASVRAEAVLAPKITLTSISAVSHLDSDRPSDDDGEPYPDLFITVVGRVTAYDEELRLAGAALENDRLKWLVGAAYEHDDIRDAQKIYMNGTNSGFGDVRFQHLENIDNQVVDTASAFASGDWRLISGLSIQGAVRYTDRRDGFRGCLADPGGPGGIRDGFAALSTALSGTPTTIAPGACVTLGADDKPLPVVAKSLNETNISFRAGLSWKFGPDALAYANVTRGFKAGAFDTLPAIRPAQLDPVPQESVTAYEIGAKTFALQHRLDIEAAAFWYDYGHKQIADYVDTGAPFGLLPALVSVPKSRVLGVEAEATWRPVSPLKITLGGEYLDSRVLGAFQTAAPLGGTVDIGGEAFPYAPRWQVTSDVQYDFGLPRGWHGYVGGGVSYRSRTTAAFGDEPLFDIASYALLDLRAGVTSPNGRWRAELWGHNVTNAYYWTSAEHVEDVVTRLAGMPATCGLTLSADF